MSTYKATPEQYIDLVAQGIQAGFETEMKVALEKMAAAIVEETVRAVAKSMTARIEEYHNWEAGQGELHVQFNYKGDPPCPSK